MSNGRTYTVRSHRRSGARRGPVPPWLAISLVVTLIGSGLVAGLWWVAEQACTGSAQAVIVSSSRTAQLLSTLAQRWQATGPSVDGTCASVQVREQETAVTAAQLAQPQWNPAVAGPAPDVWVPQSSAWARRTAATSEFADALLPDLLPSVARSPVVIAMPRELAQRFAWPKSDLQWKDLLDRLAADPSIKIGMSNPSTSTAGLLALSAIIDADDNTEVDTAELERLFSLEKRVSVYRTSSEELFDEYVRSEGRKLSAFPALEHDVVRHNLDHPGLPLVALYPSNATAEADHPYLVLQKASWTTPERVAAARAFLDYVRQRGRQLLLDDGYRDSNRVPGPRLTPDNGVLTTVNALPREVLLADSIEKTVANWTALTRPTNMLLVLDISGSMRTAVPGTGLSKLDLTRAAAKEAVSMFTDGSRVGLWTFSNRAGGVPYTPLIPIGRLDDPIGAVERREQLNLELDKLKARGTTGMYDTVWAAYQQVQSSYLPDADNMVVLLTDGGSDKGEGLTLEQLIANIGGADKSKPVKVVTIALGKDTESAPLTEMSMATGLAGSYASKRSYDIQAVLIRAIFEG